MTAVLFFLAAIGAIAGAIGVVALRNPFYSVLALVCHLVALAALFLLLRAEFVAAAQVVVYAGAVMVLYVFVVAYVGRGDEPLAKTGGALRVLGPLFALALAVELCIAMLGTGLKGISSKGAPYIPGFGSPRQIGEQFLTTYLFPFEVASLLLLVAAIGAVVLARRRRGLEPDPELEKVLHAPRPPWTGTMAEAAGIRRGGGND
jgi:NADH:ubiquinone oxidoreductase subunit 6 (subunit J)